MSKRNITIAAAAVIFAVAGIAYTQQSDSTDSEVTATAETVNENATAPETAPAANTTNSVDEVTPATTEDMQQVTPVVEKTEE